MTLPTGGSISLSQLQEEYEGVRPIDFSDYYKGGVYVPALSEGDIPTSGALNLGAFFNGANLIPPPIEVGEKLLERTLTPSDGFGTFYETYNFDSLNEDAEYQCNWHMTSAVCQYEWNYVTITVRVNDTPIYNGHLGCYPGVCFSQDSWFYGYTGTRSLSSSTFTLGLGDEVKLNMYIGTRKNSSNPSILTYDEAYAEIVRVS